MRFVATADWQLGMTAHYLDDDARPRFQQARLDAVVRIAQVASDRDAAFVVVCGDVFESNQLDRAILARTFEALRAFTVPVVLLPGNHDPLDAASIYDSAAFVERCPAHVHVLRDTVPVEVAPGVEVVGAPWRSKRPAGDLVAAALAGLDPAPEGTVRVLAAHGAVSSLDPDRSSLATIDEAVVRAALDDGRIHAVVVGDRHSLTRVADDVWYPGAPEVTHRRETDPGNVLVVDVEAPGGATRTVRVEPVRVGAWRFLVVDERVDGRDGIDALAARLDALPDKASTAVWLTLTGTLSLAEHAHLEKVLGEFAALFARLDHWERHTELAVLPESGDYSGLGLSGFAESALHELESSAIGDDEAAAATAQDALSLLYRLAGGAQ